MRTAERQGSSVFRLKGERSAAEGERRAPLERPARVRKEISARVAGSPDVQRESRSKIQNRG